MKIITLTLNPAFDIHCNVKGLALHRENLASITDYEAGGKGVNISRALKGNICRTELSQCVIIVTFYPFVQNINGI